MVRLSRHTRFILALGLFFCGCKHRVEIGERVSNSALALVEDDGERESLLEAAKRSAAWASTISQTRIFSYVDREFTAADLTSAYRSWLARANETPNDAVRSLMDYFDVYSSLASDGGILATGYYLPTVDGDLKRSPQFSVAVYPAPSDLISVDLGQFSADFKGRSLRGRLEKSRLVPYWERSEIRAGALQKVGLKPIAWVKNEFDLLNIEIQGSGLMRLPDGSTRLLSYADKNGRPYQAIGKLLVDEKKLPLEQVTMQSIRTYLEAHPNDAGRILNFNPSYVFFKFGDRVVGNLGIPLVGGRSAATDQSMIPPGLPLFLITRGAKSGPPGDRVIRRLLFNQDTGGAIRGSGRIDFYAGEGEAAADLAGRMREDGSLYVFIPKTAGVRQVSTYHN